MEETKQQQILLCDKYGAVYYAAPSDLKVGISLNVRDGAMPINGFRHPPEGDTSGWYIWGGEEFSDADDFFVPLHIEHLKNWSPLILKYLGLPPGWRFLIDDKGYEDVWQDESLLNI